MAKGDSSPCSLCSSAEVRGLLGECIVNIVKQSLVPSQLCWIHSNLSQELESCPNDKRDVG